MKQRPDNQPPRRPVVTARIAADLETPVSAFLKLQPVGASFLLESVERGVQRGRYSFIGLGPGTTITADERRVTIAARGEERSLPFSPDAPFAPLREELARHRHAGVATAGPLGGAVGLLSFDLAAVFDGVPLPAAASGFPLYHLQIPTAVAAFDHVRSEIELQVLGDDDGDVAAAEARLQELLAALAAPLPPTPVRDTPATPAPARDLFPREDFLAAVARAREHILAGDAFQIVLSRAVEGETTASALSLYRALRILNPSPYLYLLDCGSFQVVGSSPEVLVRKQGRRVAVDPIAGTRRRDEDPARDHALAEELRQDPKERAEHVMLVDLGRNDLGRVCAPGTVRTETFMSVERYSHVMHLVSRVTGELRDDADMFDLLRAAFPAGTVSGAPKIRAMQLIGELEPHRRGPYAGAVGYFTPDGDLDLCIGIRTLLLRRGRYRLQAGAGIVADSDPEREFTETEEKLAALRSAVAVAEGRT